MCVSNNINPVFNLSSNLSNCFHQFPNPFVLFISFKSDNEIDYNEVIFQIALALGNVAPDFVHQPLLSKLNKSGWGVNHFCSYANMDKNG